MSTGFCTLCFFTLSAFVIGMAAYFGKIYNAIHLPLAWLSVLAVIPVIWFSRNKKMINAVKNLCGLQ